MAYFHHRFNTKNTLRSAIIASCIGLLTLTTTTLTGCFSSGEQPNPSPNPNPSPTPNPTPPTKGDPITYNTTEWSNTPLDYISIVDIAPIVSQIESDLTSGLGKIASQKSSNTYRFSKKHDYALFDIIDSPQSLKLKWYYANTNDDDSAKKTSTEYAKTAHKFARQLMGSEGGTAIVNMLSGKTASGTQSRGQVILEGNCQAAYCTLVFSKEQSY